ncbi:unnamed protein product [Arabis nemorensis]|uniref:Uncharacterized protein n=1 Tax=Arabis nemorensis TaxID=586526 RepID=A0A565CC17_9BRAS|nr:unnamed protein product [Arabis nemorensis]
MAPLGKVEEVELHAKNSSSGQVIIKADEPLQELRLTHDQSNCPFQIKPEKKGKKEKSREK